MQIVLIIAASAALLAHQPGSTVQARATIRVISGATITEVTWAAHGRTRERVVVAGDGRPYQLRITDLE